MNKSISHKKLTDTLSLTELKSGFWLYDRTRGMNVSMRANTEEDAFVETITYYQKRLANIESEYNVLKTKVDAFIGTIIIDESENQN